MIRLFLPEVLHVLDSEIIPKSDDPLIRVLRARFEAAEKYVFESLGDLEEQTVKDIHETSEEMIDAGLLHLPFPRLWIEDPWPENVVKLLRSKNLPEGRAMWYCEENDGQIDVWGIDATPPEVEVVEMVRAGVLPRNRIARFYKFHSRPLTIDLKPDRERPDWTTSFDSPLHSIRQFIVTLATAQARIEHIPGRRWKPKQPIRTREYAHRVLRIAPAPHEGGHGDGEGHKRGLYFVSGYIWGKYTRPKEEQRWIAPQWRGDVKYGVVSKRVRKITHRS